MEFIFIYYRMIMVTIWVLEHILSTGGFNQLLFSISVSIVNFALNHLTCSFWTT
jgi:hypothetical protein